MALSTRAISPAIPLEGIDASYKLEKESVSGFEGRQYMAVKKGTAENQVMPLASGDATAGVVIVGFLQADADDGESVAVRISGTTWARAGNTITRGNFVGAIKETTEDKNGNVDPLSGAQAAGVMIAGEAMEAAADGEYFKLRITRHLQFATS